MRLIRFASQKKSRIISAIDCGDGTALPVRSESLLSGSIEPVGDEPIPIDAPLLLAPVLPPVIMGIGLNYKAHAAEQGKEPPERPMMFMKNPAALTGPHDDIVIHKICQEPEQVDYECELGIVIGKACKNASREQAIEYVAGYVAANDVSARWWQKHAGGGQFNRGKSFDTFCPIGPCLVTPDEIPNPGALHITTRLNGQIMQDSNTSDLIFPVDELIAFLSQGTTLLPGTLILTGTPAGVGFARTPPVWLKDGDLVEVEVEKIGVLSNRVREEE